MQNILCDGAIKMSSILTMFSCSRTFCDPDSFFICSRVPIATTYHVLLFPPNPSETLIVIKSKIKIL